MHFDVLATHRRAYRVQTVVVWLDIDSKQRLLSSEGNNIIDKSFICHSNRNPPIESDTVGKSVGRDRPPIALSVRPTVLVLNLTSIGSELFPGRQRQRLEASLLPSGHRRRIPVHRVRYFVSFDDRTLPCRLLLMPKYPKFLSNT